MKFPWKRADGQSGHYTFVPVVTQEDEEFSPESRKGLVVGLGWTPDLFDDISQRGRWENCEDYEEFVGYVTTNPELQGSYRKGANIYDQQRFDFRKKQLTKADTIFLRWLWLLASRIKMQ